MTPKIIFITGCSSGIGYDAVIALKSRGHRVIASCRQLADVHKLQQLGVDTIQLDVYDDF
jgi:NADP-dependent 3-hydroxy acid dehydrogenase YdfG